MNLTDLPVGLNVIISAVAGLLYAVVLISIPFRIKKYGKRQKSTDEGSDSGAGAQGNEKMFWLREISIFVMSAVIIALCAFLNFGMVGNIVLCGCGVLGAAIAAKELSAN